MCEQKALKTNTFSTFTKLYQTVAHCYKKLYTTLQKTTQKLYKPWKLYKSLKTFTQLYNFSIFKENLKQNFTKLLQNLRKNVYETQQTYKLSKTVQN